jgi:hypothetical protein
MFLYASAVTLSAFRLFLIEPVIVRRILPWFVASAAGRQFTWSPLATLGSVLRLTTSNETLPERLPHDGSSPVPVRAGFRGWTDGFYNLLSVLK